MKLIDRLRKSGMYIGGSWRDGESQTVVTNPVDQTLIAEVSIVRAIDIEESIRLAKESFGTWSRLSPYQRSEYLDSFAAAIIAHQQELAELMTLEGGKPLREALLEIEFGASYFRWYADEAKRGYGEVVPPHSTKKLLLTNREPLGVCAAITPWNFPHAMIARKLSAALAAGCTFILKPAPETPLSALALALLADEINLPRGVFSVLNGNAEEIGIALITSPDVRKITFTGSTEVGKVLMKQSADTLKRLTLELGGNAPFIVFDDASLEVAVQQGLYGKYRNAGQTCICANRFLVQKGIAGEFVERFVAASKALVVGNGLDPATDIGPLINQRAKEKVRSLVQDALAHGATMELGSEPGGDSLFVAPIVLTGLNQSMRLWREEVFGPVAAIATFETEAEAITLANDTVHGLAAYLFTRDLSRAVRVSRELESGMVGVNDAIISAAHIPFGGVKQSGFGREGGSIGLEEYQVVKYISIGIE